MRFRAHAGTFIYCSLALLLAAGLYQRVANPSLEYRLDPSPAQSAPMQAREHEHPPLAPEDAEKLAQAMAGLRENPADAGRLLAIAGIFSRNKDWINAITFLKRAAAADPADARPPAYLGVAYSARGEFAKAAEALENALALAPGDAAVQFSLAHIYRDRCNKPERAKELFEAVAASPSADSTLREQARRELGLKP